MKRVWLALLLLLTASLERSPTITAQSTGWSTNGPEGGTIIALASDPHAAATLYAATWNSGVFKSTDGGGRWINLGLLNVGVDALAIDPQTPGIIYAGTYNGGLFKSIDGGGSWSGASSGLTDTSVLSVAIDPANTGTLYAGTTSGIFKSTDGGGTWSSVKTWVASASVLAMAFDPHASGTIYAGRNGTGGVVKSTDAGNTWNDTGLTGRHVYALAVDPNASVLYASTHGGVFKSADAGRNWTLLTSGVGAVRFNALVMDGEATTLYVGTENGVFKSSDGGTTWGAVNAGLPAITVLALAIDRQNPSTIYAGTHAPTSNDWDKEIGVFKTTDGGGNWSAANTGLIATSVLDVVVDPQTPATVYAGSSRGVFKSTDQGASWRPINAGLTHPAYRLAIDPQSPETLYGGTANGVFKSVDGGMNWAAASSGLTNPFVETLIADPGVSGTLYAGTLRGLFKSTDGAASWSPVDLGMGDSVRVFSFTIDPQVSTILYAAVSDRTLTHPGGTFKSTDGGTSWTRLTPMFLSVAVDPRNSSTLYARGGDGVLKSTDGGATWNASNSGLPAMLVAALAIDSQAPATIYAAGHGGVFKSTDGGANWTDFNHGLTNRSVNALAIDAAILVAGTTAGAFTTALTPAPKPQFVLTARTAGPGRGTITSHPSGIDCGADCSESFVSGTTVTLTAKPAFGSLFTGWSGCDAVSGDSCLVTMRGERSVTATFLGLPVIFPSLSFGR